MNIDMKSIQAKAEKYFQSPRGKIAVENAMDRTMMTPTLSGKNYQPGGVMGSPAQAAEKFIKVLYESIDKSASQQLLGPTAVAALSHIKYDPPEETTLWSGWVTSDYSSAARGKAKLYTVRVYFDGDLHRESLDPKNYPEGVDDITALLNSGYRNGMLKGAVRGVWKNHGDEPIWSRSRWTGAHFIEDAIATFMQTYAELYGVVAIMPDAVYNI